MSTRMCSGETDDVPELTSWPAEAGPLSGTQVVCGENLLSRRNPGGSLSPQRHGSHCLCHFFPLRQRNTSLVSEGLSEVDKQAVETWLCSSVRHYACCGWNLLWPFTGTVEFRGKRSISQLTSGSVKSLTDAPEYFPWILGTQATNQNHQSWTYVTSIHSSIYSTNIKHSLWVKIRCFPGL